MSFFHTHYFYQSDVPEILTCHCGQTRDIHRHEWERTGEEIVGVTSRNITGIVLRCTRCGALHNHRVDY